MLGCCLALCPLQSHGQRMVFAHYMVTNQDYQGDTDPTQERKIAAYEREMREAQAVGIDGFVLNVGGWLREPYYIRYTAQIFEAALRLNSGFKLMLSADMCCGNTAEDIEDIMRRFAGNPRYAKVYFQQQGKSVLTTFAGDKIGTDGWQQIRTDLEFGTHPSTSAEPKALRPASDPPGNAPLQVFFVPALFFDGELPKKKNLDEAVAHWKAALDGMVYWGIAGVPGSHGALDQLPSSRYYAEALHHAGKLYVAPVCLQFWGANANRYYEYSGATGMRAMWMDAIRVTHPEWVEIITWNDFIEGTYISPIDDPNRYAGANFLDTTGVPRGIRGYFHSHAAATDLLKFYIAWYKTGIEPAIEHDAVYFFYRTQPKAVDAGKPSVANKFGPVDDAIYITSNLTAAAELRVTSGNETRTLHLPAGSSDTQTPFQVGEAPRFELLRTGKTLGTAVGNDPITAKPVFNDFYYSSGVLTVSH
jgi:hypothetical protein